MLFEIVTIKSKNVLLTNLTLEQVAKRLQCHFHQIDDYAFESILFAEKEFLIRAKDQRNQPFIKKNAKDFTVIVRRIK